jgi:hypothetical protein
VSTRANARVCFIGGAGHSGSTLLGVMLGAHPRIFYAGEAKKSLFLGDETKPLKKRVCKLCGPACAIWGGLAIDGDVYEALSRKTGRPTVVDSTKAIEWIDAQSGRLAALGVDARLFFLSRDGRAVVASRLRKYPESSAGEHAAEWVRQIRATEALASRFPGPVVRVKYEELASRPAGTMRGICAGLGIELADAMLAPWTTEQHPLGGNAGTQFLLSRARAGASLSIGEEKRTYYEAHPPAIVLDLRWRAETTPEALAEFEAVAGETNRPYRWDAS